MVYLLSNNHSLTIRGTQQCIWASAECPCNKCPCVRQVWQIWRTWLGSLPPDRSKGRQKDLNGQCHHFQFGVLKWFHPSCQKGRRQHKETRCKYDHLGVFQITSHPVSGSICSNSAGQAHMAKHSGITFIGSLVLHQPVCAVITKVKSRKSCASTSVFTAAIVMWLM
jgi:hypothetical protein